jgi:HK97 family phage prohead protease
MHFRDLKFEVKADRGKPGTFEGRASVYGNVDSYGDVVMPGAFSKTLQEHGNRIVILSQHDPAQSIGIAELRDESDGLHVRGQLALEVSKAAEEYARLKAGLISGISIGYETIRESFKGAVRELREIRLWEVSLVTFPANSAARVTAVKDNTDADVRRLHALIESMRDDAVVLRMLQQMRAAAKGFGR